MKQMHTQRRLVKSKAINGFYKDLLFGFIIGLSILSIGLSAPKAHDRVRQLIPISSLATSPEWGLERIHISLANTIIPNDRAIPLSGPLITKKIHQLYRSSPNAAPIANIQSTPKPPHKSVLFFACLIFTLSYTCIAGIWRRVKRNYLP